MEESVLMLAQSGLDILFVIDLDIFSLNSLIETHWRLLARAKIESAQTAQLSSQATGKDLLKWLKKRWVPLLGTGEHEQTDADKLLQDFGSGF